MENDKTFYEKDERIELETVEAFEVHETQWFPEPGVICRCAPD